MMIRKMLLLLCLIALSSVAFGQGGESFNSIPRERPRLNKGNVVADNGWPLRGETVYCLPNGWEEDSWFWRQRVTNEAYWIRLKDTLRLNAIRLAFYRYPCHYSPSPDKNDPKGCYPWQVYSVANVIKVADTVISLAAQNGMYVLIDYHPVYGLDTTDWKTFWDAVAPRYRDRSHVFYELANEPMSHPNPHNFVYSDKNAGKKVGWMAAWQRRAVKYVSALAPKTLVVICSWSGGVMAPSTQNMYPSRYYMEHVLPDPEIEKSRTVVGWHGYWSISRGDLAGLRDSMAVFGRNLGPQLMTEHNIQTPYFRGDDPTDPALIAKAFRSEWFEGSHGGAGYETLGLSWFTQSFTSRCAKCSQVRGGFPSKDWGHVIVDSGLVRWQRDPLVR